MPTDERDDMELNTDEEDDLLDDQFDWVETSGLALLETSLGQQPAVNTPTTEDGSITLDSLGRQHTLEEYNRNRHRRGRTGGPPVAPSPPINSLSTARPILPHVPQPLPIKPPRWNFGIRSSSPPMEVMSELYRSIKHLGAEWREKEHPWSFVALPYPPTDHDDITPASDIFFVQTRWTLRGHSVCLSHLFSQYHGFPTHLNVDLVL